MIHFAYQAVTSTGEKVKGTIEANDAKDAAVKLHETGYKPLKIEEAGRSPGGKVFDRYLGRVRSQELLIFYTQLRDMLSAGINFLACLESIREQTPNEKLKAAIQDIVGNIRKGTSLSEAFEVHREIFPDLFIHMIKSGEASGELELVLNSYAILYEKQLDLRQKIVGALFYPLILLCMGLAVILFLVTFIIPQFVTIFSGAGIPLPWVTRILYVAGTATMLYWYWMFLGAFLTWWAVRRYIKTGTGRSQLDRLKLSLPVLGPLNRSIAFSRFSNTLGMLLHSGIPIIRALELSGAVMQNVVLERSIATLPERMKRGENLSAMLREGGEVPSNMIQMIAIGEETGNLGDMLGKAGAFYDKSIENSIKQMTTLIEPLFLVVMGGAIGFIMASIMIPLFRMINVAKV